MIGIRYISNQVIFVVLILPIISQVLPAGAATNENAVLVHVILDMCSGYIPSVDHPGHLAIAGFRDMGLS